MSRIKVVLRVKPEEHDISFKHFHFNEKDKNTVEITVPNGTRHEFTFDHVFGMDSSQASVFNAHSHLVNEVLDGYNGSIIAYGQTGSGKVLN